MINTELKIAVLTGGIGDERDISLQSGQCVSDALGKAGFEVVTVDINPDKLDILSDTSIDVFFIAIHGQFGEDGQLQQILEDKSLLYTGSGPQASRLAFDKLVSKKLFAKVGAAVPGGIEFNDKTDTQQLEKQLRNFADKYVIKPVKQGSSVGISIVSSPKDAVAAAKETFSRYGDCMIEEFIPGREVTVGILCDRPLPVIEIKPQSSFYDYNAKYIDDKTQYLLDTITDPDIIDKLNKAALNCFNALGCRHFARVDFILDGNGTAHVLEINTIPGFTKHSLLPKAAEKIGLPMSRLCTRIVDAAYSSLVNHPTQNKI